MFVQFNCPKGSKAELPGSLCALSVCGTVAGNINKVSNVTHGIDQRTNDPCADTFTMLESSQETKYNKKLCVTGCGVTKGGHIENAHAQWVCRFSKKS